MATTQTSTPSFFNFLREGVLLPDRNRRLFPAVFALAVASTSLFLLVGDLAVQPVADKLNLDAKALNGTDPRSPEFAHLLQQLQDDTRNLMLVTAAYVLFAVVVGSFIRIIIQFAAVTTYFGELHTFAELLGKAKTQMKGPLVTLAFVYTLEVAYFALLAVLGALFVFLMLKHYFALLYVESLVLLLACIFLFYFSFLCSLSFVVAVAEPGCQGAGAVGRAWRLMKNKRWRALLFIAVTGVLATVVSPVHTLAKTCALKNMASGLLLDFLYAVLTAAVELFAVCAMTAFYYECEKCTEASATGYVKVSTQEQISA